MRLLPPPFRDDLGRRVPAAVVTEEVLGVLEADETRRPALRGLRREAFRGGVVHSTLVSGAIVAAALLLSHWKLRTGLAGHLLFAAAVLAIVFLAHQVGPSLYRVPAPGRFQGTRQRFLAALLCPACAHDLKGVPPRADGVTVCPECGAAWKLEGTQARGHAGTEGKRE